MHRCHPRVHRCIRCATCVHRCAINGIDWRKWHCAVFLHKHPTQKTSCAKESSRSCHEDASIRAIRKHVNSTRSFQYSVCKRARPTPQPIVLLIMESNDLFEELISPPILPEADLSLIPLDWSSPAPAPLSITTLPETAQNENVSHTRRCRAKVNSNFQRLLDQLPPPPPGVEVKHKAQILAYAVDTFRQLRCRNMRLEMQLALSSPYQLQRWVRSVVSSATNLTDALKPFMALICLTKQWKYAELWQPVHCAETQLCYISGALPPTVQGEELYRLKKYRTNSRKYKFKPRSGVPGRVFLTMRPEWLPLLNDPVAFPRAPHAVRHRVQVTFAVPVIVNGSVQMVVEFYDTEKRDYDPTTLNIANDIAMMFGKAFTAPNTSMERVIV